MDIGHNGLLNGQSSQQIYQFSLDLLFLEVIAPMKTELAKQSLHKVHGYLF